MLVVGPSQSIAGGSTSATTVNCTIMGCLTDNSVPPIAQSYKMLYQGQLASSVTAVISNSASQEILISSIHLFNTGSSQQTVTLAINGTASSNNIGVIAVPGNGWATYEDGSGWRIYTSTGVLIVTPAFLPMGLGTPSSATTSLTASTEVVQGGTLFQLGTSYLQVGARFRWYLVVNKTAAGTATWAMKVKYGTAGTTGDAAIASWTSGTNTAAIDQAVIIVECAITALGSGTSATAACVAFSSNRLTDVTGLGKIDPIPGSTAGFDSTATNPYFHIDITAGASAVMVGAGMAEQVK